MINFNKAGEVANIIGDTIGGSSSTTTSTHVDPNSANSAMSTGTIVGIVVVSIVVIGIVVFLILR